MNDELILELARFSDDPYGFVQFAFPWGEPGELENARIEPWQEAWLHEATARLRAGASSSSQIVQMATTSGHGIGKSALVSWVILWALATFEDTVGVVTANTENQLKTKTWVQLSKWFRLCIAKSLFEMTATKICSIDPAHADTWRVDMVPWSERNTEAFAGLHNQGKRILVIFDEGSAIPDVIWEVTEGALTDHYTQIIWAVFGNPTRNSGRFRECFSGGRFAHRWSTHQVDSRSVSLTNKEQIAAWIADYGDDSDFVRIRVKGEFPRIDSDSFIPYELARTASERNPEHQYSGLLIGVDVARFGDNFSVIYPRKGRDAKTLQPLIYQGLDTMSLANAIADRFYAWEAAMVFVDGGGVGGGVVDRLRTLSIPVIDVQFGSRPDGINNIQRGVRYFNKRSEIWGALRDWLYDGGAIIDHPKGHDLSLVTELSAPTYGMNSRDEIVLESKSDMRRRKVSSPDIADALACTFALPDVFFSHATTSSVPMVAADYNPYAKEQIYV